MVILFGEITSFIIMTFERNKSISVTYDINGGLQYISATDSDGISINNSQWFIVIYKLFVELIFITFNCSVCYAMAIYLKLNKSILLKIWYSSIGLTLMYLVFHTVLRYKFGRFNYLMFAVISAYSLKLLYQIRQKDLKLFDNKQPTFIQRLIYLEWYIFIFATLIYPISLYRERLYESQVTFSFDLITYIMHQFRLTISCSFLIKMYIFIIQWGSRSNSKPAGNGKVYDDSNHQMLVKV